MIRHLSYRSLITNHERQASPIPSRLPTLCLYVPGLAGQPGWPAALALPPAPALARLLLRADAGIAAADCELELCRAWGIAPGPDGPPVAALGALADLPGAGPGPWLRADPVHLRPALDKLLLFDAHALVLAADEADALIAALEGHLAGDGLRLLRGAAPDRWYLETPQPPALRLHPPRGAWGRHAGASLPEGPDARIWHRRMNEWQMLLHEHPVNVQRAARGLPEVNAVWPWGGGSLPAPTGARPDLAVGGVPLLRGLALHTGGEWLALPGGATELLDGLPGAPALEVWLDDCAGSAGTDDPGGWQHALARLETAWFAPLEGTLRAGRAGRVDIVTEGRRWRVTRRSLRRLWRRGTLAAALGG